MDNLSLRITSVAPARQGEGDDLRVWPISDEALYLTVTRLSRRKDGRGRRSVSMLLSRSEALTLGRHLVAQAGGLTDLGPLADVAVRLVARDEDEGDDYTGAVEAERDFGDNVIITTERTYWDDRCREATSVWVTRREARRLALGLLALARD